MITDIVFLMMKCWMAIAQLTCTPCRMVTLVHSTTVITVPYFPLPLPLALQSLPTCRAGKIIIYTQYKVSNGNSVLLLVTKVNCIVSHIVLFSLMCNFHVMKCKHWFLVTCSIEEINNEEISKNIYVIKSRKIWVTHKCGGFSITKQQQNKK